MQNDAYQGQGNKKPDKIPPVLSGEEGKNSSDKPVGDSSQRNGNDKRHQIEEVFYHPFSYPAEKAEDKNQDSDDTNPYHR